MDKKYMFDGINVVDLSKLYEDNSNDTMFYWCNACGDVNLPSDVGIVLHTEDELPNETNSMVKGHLYGGDDDMETDQPLAIIVDGVRDTNDESKRALWVDKEVTHIESLTDDYQERQKAITEKQIADLDVGDYLKDFDYAAYGKRLSSKAENTVEFVADTIVSRSKQEIDLVANGMEAMGLSIETGYFDPDDEPTDDVPKQLMGFYYVRMSAEA